MPEGKAILEVRGEDEFLKIVKENELVIVDFWAPWCAPCLAMAPAFEAVARRFSGEAVFAKVNIDENMRMAMALGIRAIPTIIVFKKGKPVNARVGLMDEEELTKMVEEHLTEA